METNESEQGAAAQPAEKPGESLTGVMWCYNAWEWGSAEDYGASGAARPEANAKAGQPPDGAGGDELMRYYNS